MPEEFSLRRVAREVVEEYPNATSEQIVDTIMARIRTPEVWEALRQALTPIVVRAFEERDALDSSIRLYSTPPSVIPDHKPLSAEIMSGLRAATTDRGDTDHSSSAAHTGTVGVTPPVPGGGDQPPFDAQTTHVTAAPSSGDHTPVEPQPTPVATPSIPSPHPPSARTPVRRTKTSLVRSHAERWLKEQSLTTSHGSVPLGSATFEDLMDAVRSRRHAAYASMARADTLERLANLLQTSESPTVAELPTRLLDPFIASNPEIA